jgi:hypothetical protein
VTALTDPATNYPNVPAIDFRILNPNQYEIAREVRTVAGSDFGRLDADGSHTIDQRSIDYNLVNGEYKIIVSRDPGAPLSGAFIMDIRVDGSQNIRIFQNYVSNFSGVSGKNSPRAESDSLIFYYSVEQNPSMSPPNGVKTTTQRPAFGWAKLVDTVASTKYTFQLDRFYDFRAPIYDDSTLTFAHFTPPINLGKDSIFYWRVRGKIGGIWSGWSRTMAAYIGGACCTGTSGNVNGSGGVDLADLSALVSFLTGGGFVFPCTAEANVNTVGGVDLADLSALVTYLTGGGYALPSCP